MMTIGIIGCDGYKNNPQYNNPSGIFSEYPVYKDLKQEPNGSLNNKTNSLRSCYALKQEGK